MQDYLECIKILFRAKISCWGSNSNTFVIYENPFETAVIVCQSAEKQHKEADITSASLNKSLFDVYHIMQSR